MSDVHFVFYELGRGTVGRRPAVLSIYQDDAAVPNYAALGLDPALHGHVRLTVFDAGALSSGKSVTVNSLATLPSTSADFEVDRFVLPSLVEDQARAQAILQGMIDEWAWTQRLDAKITAAERLSARAYLQALAAIPTTYATLWASDPLAVFDEPGFPVQPTLVGASRDLAERIGEVMDKGSTSRTVLTDGLGGVNFIDNSRFTSILADGSGAPRGWNLFTSGASQAAVTGNIQPAGGGYAGTNYPVLYILQPNALSGAGEFSHYGARHINVDGTEDRRAMSVRAGDTVEISVKGLGVDCSWQIAAYFYSRNDVQVGAPLLSPVYGPGSYLDDDPELWPTRFFKAQVPPGASYVYPTFRKLPTSGGPTSYLFLYKPFLGFTTADATEPTEWVPDVPDFLDGRRVIHSSMPLNRLWADAPSGGDVPIFVPDDGVFRSRQHVVLTIPFVLKDPLANDTRQAQVQMPDGPVARDWRAPRAGRILGASITSQAARSAGSAIVQARVAGTVVGINGGACALGAGATLYSSTILKYGDSPAGLRFAAGDLVGLSVNTASWAPTTTDFSLLLFVQLDPW